MLSDHRYTAIFGAALLTAGGATFAVYRMLETAGKPQQEPVRAVVVAVRDVPAGIAVPREALGVASWPVRIAPPESFVTADSVIGRVTRAPLVPGDPVLPNRLAVRGAAPGLEGAIDPARRAMAVRVNEAASVSGLVRANSRVDVLMAGHGEGQLATARVLMSDVRVLGVGSVRPPEPSPGSTTPEPAPSATTAAIVTLEVTPAQAEQLAAAESQGAIQVVLRGYGSTGDLGTGQPNGDVGARFSAVSGSTPGLYGTSAMGRPVSLRGASPSVSRAERRTPRSGSSADVASFAPARHAPDPMPVARARPESTTVYVYRGGAMTALRLETTQPSTATSTPTASTSATSPDAAARDGAVRPVRTADAHLGPHAP